MYRNTAPPSPPFVIEVEDGNCILRAPLADSQGPSHHHHHHHQAHGWRAAQSSAAGPSGSIPRPYATAYEPLLVTTPRRRDASLPSSATGGYSLDGDGGGGNRQPSPILYSFRQPSQESRPPLLPAQSRPHQQQQQQQSQTEVPAHLDSSGAATVTYAAAHGPGTLGPLILVNRRRRVRNRAHSDGGAGDTSTALVPAGQDRTLVATSESEGEGDGNATASAGWVLVTAREAASHRGELAGLRGRLEAAAAALKAAERRTAAAAEEMARGLADGRRAEDQQRRRRMQAAIDALRDECAELTARLEAAAAHGAPAAPSNSGSSGGGGTAAQQAEWGRQLQDVEAYWRQRLRTAGEHWAAEVDRLAAERADLRQRLARAGCGAEAAQAAAAEAAGERRALAAECDRLLSLTSDGGGGVPAALHENAALKSRLREREVRQEALLAQVESYAEEAARLRADADHRLRAARQELDRERARGADLTRLYSAQVQALHQQLADAVEQRDELAARLGGRRQ